MTYEEMLAMLESLGENATYQLGEDRVVYITLQDITLEYDENAVNNFVEMLKEAATEYDDDDFYHYYYFEDFTVEVGCESFED